MAAKVNLLNTKKKKAVSRTPRQKKQLINSTILLVIALTLVSSGVIAYKLVLEREVEALDGAIAEQDRIIASLKDIEQRKGLLTLKTNELSALQENRFDYVKAIEDAQKLFGFSIDIVSIDITEDGVVSIESEKVSDITLSERDAFATNISELNLTIIVPNSTELEETIDTLLEFKGQGLENVLVTNSTLLDDGRYEVNFTITFESTARDDLDTETT